MTASAENEEWILIHFDKEQRVSFNVSLGNFSLLNNKTRIWVMEDFESTQKVKDLNYRSIKSLLQFNCDSNTMRILAYSLYKVNNANGLAIFSKSEALDWDKVKANSINSEYQKIACSEAKPGI
jgi:hypothetical protein